MPFQCPECSFPSSLRITSRIELPPDSRSDEISLQVIQCRNCGFAGLAIYEESRRGALDSEIIHHIGYHVHPEDLKTIKGMIHRCPNPKDPRCTCASHLELRKKNAYGRWDGLSGMRLGLSFDMKLE